MDAGTRSAHRLACEDQARDSINAPAPSILRHPTRLRRNACMDDIDNALERIIAIAGDRFDSHDIIRTFAHGNQRRYIELLQGTHGDKPFQTLHSALGRRIKTLCERHGFAGEASNSLDVFNQNSSCIAWSRG
jgi:hypothetical protein